MTNREILPLYICGHIEKIMGQQGLHWEYSFNISLFTSSQAHVSLRFPREEHTCTGNQFKD